MQIRDGMKLRTWQPTPVFSPGESHGQRSLAGYSPRDRIESNMTEATEYACRKLRADPTAKELRVKQRRLEVLSKEKEKNMSQSLRTRLKKMQQNTQEG